MSSTATAPPPAARAERSGTEHPRDRRTDPPAPPPVALPILGIDEEPRRFRMTRDEYRAFEDAQTETKFEWVDGEALEMTGGTAEHAELGAAFAGELRNRLKGRAFKIYNGDLQVRIPNGPYRYPDATVAAVPPELEWHPQGKRLTLLNPVVLVEVLSQSTALTDTVAKLDEYGRIPTVTDYLIAAQDEVRVVHHRREGGGWRTVTLRGTDAVVRLGGPGADLPLGAVYEGVL